MRNLIVATGLSAALLLLAGCGDGDENLSGAWRPTPPIECSDGSDNGDTVSDTILRNWENVIRNIRSIRIRKSNSIITLRDAEFARFEGRGTISEKEGEIYYEYYTDDETKGLIYHEASTDDDTVIPVNVEGMGRIIHNDFIEIEDLIKYTDPTLGSLSITCTYELRK